MPYGPVASWDEWQKLPLARKHALQDLDGLTQQLIGLEGCRVEVVRTDGETKRFNVGRSTGWRPCHLEIHNIRCCSGSPADHEYKSVRVVWRPETR